MIDIPGEANDQVEAYLQRVLDQGGEGVVIRNPNAIWTPKRHRAILKYKPFQDAEARVVGFTSGRETNKGSRLLGKIGALIVDYQGKRLELAGLTDAEREFADPTGPHWAANNPGHRQPLLGRRQAVQEGPDRHVQIPRTDRRRHPERGALLAAEGCRVTSTAVPGRSGTTTAARRKPKPCSPILEPSTRPVRFAP